MHRRLMCYALFGLALVLIFSSIAPAQNDVTFRVNMRVKMLEGAFRPDSGDIVRVAGSFNDWGNSTDTLRDEIPLDSIYQKTISLPTGSIQYKFLKTLRGGLDWEGGGNRQYTVVPGPQTLPVAYFDYDSLVSLPTTANITWRTDMRAFTQIGWFVPATDSMQVRGPFNNWGSGNPLTFDPLSQRYRTTTSYSGFTFDEIPHKYFMRLDSASAAVRFPDFGSNRDGHEYEHPYERGDGNRLFNIGTGGSISTPSFWFCSIHQNGLMLNTTDTCRVTFRVNMGPATRESDPFVPGTDTAKLTWQDPLFRSAQRGNQGVSNFPHEVVMTRQGPTDSVYTVSVKVKGKAHYGLMYTYSYTHPGGGGLSEGGGLGAQNPYRVRFIQLSAANTFPPTYTCPLDAWQRNAPMPAETPQYPITGVTEDPSLGMPTEYRLLQNYPNPFNPTTRIAYSIPERAKVTLKVFNLLGQEVATLVNEEQEGRRNYVALFEANNLASGVYLYRLQAGSFSETKKMILMK